MAFSCVARSEQRPFSASPVLSSARPEQPADARKGAEKVISTPFAMVSERGGRPGSTAVLDQGASRQPVVTVSVQGNSPATGGVKLVACAAEVPRYSVAAMALAAR